MHNPLLLASQESDRRDLEYYQQDNVRLLGQPDEAAIRQTEEDEVRVAKEE